MKMLLTTVILPRSSKGETSLKYTGTAIDANPASVVLASVVLQKLLLNWFKIFQTVFVNSYTLKSCYHFIDNIENCNRKMIIQGKQLGVIPKIWINANHVIIDIIQQHKTEK